MTEPLPRRSLQTRLALLYAAGVYVAGLVVLVIVTVPLAGLQSVTPVGTSAPRTITGTGPGIGPHQVLVGSAVALVVLVPVALAAGWFVAGRFLQPLRSITATATGISAGNLHRRLDLGEPVDELTTLGSMLDDLFARLEASFEAQRHFVANASHELRTPLAGLRTVLEVALADPDADDLALRSACQQALALGLHQERLVAALLTLATSERGLSASDTIDLAEVVTAALAVRRDQARQRGIELTEHLAPALTVGDPRLLRSLVDNLVDNAIRHNHANGFVALSTSTAGPQTTLTVTNSGPVIDDDQLQRLFQPFQRLAADRHGRRDGYGLGLAIVDAVARAHHATHTTRPLAEGGLAITVRFAGPASVPNGTTEAPPAP